MVNKMRKYEHLENEIIDGIRQLPKWKKIAIAAGVAALVGLTMYGCGNKYETKKETEYTNQYFANENGHNCFEMIKPSGEKQIYCYAPVRIDDNNELVFKRVEIKQYTDYMDGLHWPLERMAKNNGVK